MEIIAGLMEEMASLASMHRVIEEETEATIEHDARRRRRRRRRRDDEEEWDLFTWMEALDLPNSAHGLWEMYDEEMAADDYEEDVQLRSEFVDENTTYQLARSSSSRGIYDVSYPHGRPYRYRVAAPFRPRYVPQYIVTRTMSKDLYGDTTVMRVEFTGVGATRPRQLVTVVHTSIDVLPTPMIPTIVRISRATHYQPPIAAPTPILRRLLTEPPPSGQ